MLKIFRILLFFLIILSAVSASAVELQSGKEYFLRTPLYAERDSNEIDWINYSDMRVRLKSGDKLTVLEIKDNIVRFFLNNQIYNFTYTRNGLSGTADIWDKYFSSRDIKEEIDIFPERIRNDILLGRVELGMTKEQVLLAVGCPPVIDSKKTFDLTMSDIRASDQWLYYRSRLNKWSVRFSGGKVVSVAE